MARGSSPSSPPAGGSSGAIEMRGQQGNLDQRGTATIVKKYLVDDESKLGEAPMLAGYRPISISYTKVFDNFYEQSVTYQTGAAAIITGASGGLLRGNLDEDGFFEIFCSFEVKRIELHPRINDLVSRYNATVAENGDVLFPPYISDAAVGALSAGRNVVNPMFGVKFYKEPTMTLRHTFNVPVINPAFFSRTGRKTSVLPGNLNFLPPAQNGRTREWLIQAPSASMTGNTWRIQQEYVLLDARGVADEIFLSQSR